MDPRRPADFKQLVSAVLDSRRKLQPFREKRRELLSLLVGSEYSDEGEAKRVYLNLMALATNIYVRQCAVRAPTARVTSPYPDLYDMAENLTLACKDAAEECELGRVLRRAVTEAIFSPMATVKIGLEAVDEQDLGGEKVPVTEPFVKLVSFDDYVRDMSARSAYEPAFEGDTYYMTREEIETLYPDAGSLDLAADDLGVQGDAGEERAESLSHTPTSGEDNWNKKIAVQDVYLTKERLLVTYILGRPTKPLAVVEFPGPERGPYLSLWFTDVPDNAMPLPPFSVLKNIQKLANSLFRRMANQAEVQKRVVAFSDEESAIRFAKAHDGDGVQWDGQKPEMIEVGGIDQRVMALFIQLKDVFAWAAGNLDSLGGLSPMAETAKQDELLAKSASAQLADMQDATSEFAQNIFRQIALYEWTDPLRERILQRPIPGTGDTIPVLWSPETRRGDFIDMNFVIIPQSMRDDAPGAKIQRLSGVIAQFFMPLQPFFQQQGLTLDGRRLTQLIAAYSNLPELEQLIVSIDPNKVIDMQGPTGNPNPVAAGKPAHTTRTYERVNRPGATRVGKDMALIQTLAGGGVQPAEANAMSMAVS